MSDLTDQIDQDIGNTFLDLAGFGSEVTITKVDQSTSVIAGLFNEPFKATDLEGNSSNTDPAVLVKSSDISDIDTEGPITIDGNVYYGRKFEPDGQGTTLITLSHNA